MNARLVLQSRSSLFHSGLLPALIWATILAVALWPLYLKFASRSASGPSSLTALIFTGFVAVILFTPMSLAVYQLAQQSDQIVSWLKKAQEGGIAVPEWISRLPKVGEQWWRANSPIRKLRLPGRRLSTQIVQPGSLIRRSVASRILETCDHILGHAGEGVIEKIVESTRGTVNGTVIVALGEGLLIGVGYLVAGVPNAAMFTVVTIALAMLPFGAWVAFTAAAVVLVSSGGSEAAAAGVFCWGAIVMFAGDHFVWRTLVGGAARLPFSSPSSASSGDLLPSD